MQTEELTITAAAARLGVSRGTVAAWITGGRLPARREGRCMVIAASDLDALRIACDQCGRVFIPAKTGQRFCSDACRKRCGYLAHKTANPATRGPGRPRRENPASADPAPIPDRLAAVLKATRARSVKA